MNYAFLPDLSALTILIVILLVLRRRHPHEGAGVWLLGLGFTLVEAVAHTFYAREGLPARLLHIIVLDCYLLAGLTFTWASGSDRLPPRTRFAYLALNALPLLALDTIYGLHLPSKSAYLPVLAAGLLLGVGTSLSLRRSWRLAVAYLVGWLALSFLISKGDLREAVYWSLCCVYLVAGLNFARRLPRQSTGRLAIVTGFLIWSLCFLLHPWVVHYREYADIASHVWNMQKSLISIGMLLVMLERQLAHSHWLALHDDLTGLPNRRLFDQRMTSQIRTCQISNSRLAVFLLDLNGFKEINDSLGHQAGDQVLKGLAQNLQRVVQPAETLARLGGDEFVLISCAPLGSARFDRLTEDLRIAVGEPLEIGGATLRLTASLGLAIFPEDAADANRLLGIADQRMYMLKQRSGMELSLAPDLAPDLNPDLAPDLDPDLAPNLARDLAPGNLVFK